MKTRKLHIFSLLFGICAALTLAACQDDFDYGQGAAMADGSVTLSAVVEFEPRAAALESRAAGDAMADIRSLSMIIYKADEDTTLYGVYNIADFEVSRPAQSQLPTDYVGVAAESATARASFSVPDVPMGNYYIYIAANMGALSAADVATPAMLRSIRLDWDADNPGANDQMLGYLTVGNGGSEGFDAPLIVLNRQNAQNLHAWLKRAASKVTLVIDPKGMHNEIAVYIHKVTICDIPMHAYLGQTSRAESLTELLGHGETIYFNAEGKMMADDPAPDVNQYESWMGLRRGSGLKGAVDADGNTHGERQMALYFYENAQGNYADDPQKDRYYKQQHWDEVGTVVNTPGQERFKDNVPYGTYIEVEGYYVSTHSPVVSNGEIKYRFMLGQDVDYDFNAYRNRHYKVTMELKGYANQADWHIEYVEEAPEIFAPSSYYVSYLYNRRSMLPVRITGNCIHLEAEIIENNWHPYDADSPYEVPDATMADDRGTFNWNKQVWENAGNSGKKEDYTNYRTLSSTLTDAEKNNRDFYYGRHTVTYDAGTPGERTMCITPPHAGFLTLTVPTAYEDWSLSIPATIFGTASNDFYSWGSSINALRDYYYGKGGKGDDINYLPQHKRIFTLSPGQQGAGRNAYTVVKNDDGSTALTIPLWTRPQSMIYISGFTGNNPYEAFQRKATIRFRATFKLKTGETRVRYKDVEILQCRRVINPKGIWRSWNDNTPFDVTLMRRDSPKSETFTAFHSSGSWKAYIDGASTATSVKFFELSGGVKQVGDTIYGDDDTPISFRINFKNLTKENHSNCGIVRVLYHGFNAEHTVFVRQGFSEPIDVAGDGTKWSSFSVYAASGAYKTTANARVELTKSPLALGTFFKRGNYNEGLVTKNNLDLPRHTAPNGNTFLLRSLKADGSYADTYKSWANIKGVAGDASGKTMTGDNDTKFAFTDFETDEYVYSVPTYQQYNNLVLNCDFGFGVLYSDGATSTATTAEEAFRFLDYDNQGLENTEGMRGVIVYNRQNADMIFFPIGYSGVGRRTIQACTDSYKTERGILRYGSSRTELSFASNAVNQFRPIPYNNHENNGAIYWLRTNSGSNSGWDMNFNDLNFAPYDYACAFGQSIYGGGGDALPIKLVVKKKK